MLSSTLSVHFTLTLLSTALPSAVLNLTVYPLFSCHTAVSDVTPAGTASPGAYVFVPLLQPARLYPVSGAVIPSAAGAVKTSPLLTARFILFVLPLKLPPLRSKATAFISSAVFLISSTGRKPQILPAPPLPI